MSQQIAQSSVTIKSVVKHRHETVHEVIETSPENPMSLQWFIGANSDVTYNGEKHQVKLIGIEYDKKSNTVKLVWSEVS